MEEIAPSREPSVVQLCKDFGETTTLHGAGRAFTSKRPWRRVVWTVLLLCSTLWAVHQFIEVAQDFYTYPVTTLVTLKHESRILFPAITICNLNSLKLSMLPDWVNQVLHAIQVEKQRDFREMLNSVFRQMNSNDRFMAGHHMTDMLISCNFNRKTCTAGNFTEVDMGIYGKCHTFQFDDRDQAFIKRPGSKNGLIMEMAIEHSEYNSMESEAGVQVIIHDHGECIFPEDEGIWVPPGMATSIAIKKTVTHRLPPPYGECVEGAGDPRSKMYMFDDEHFVYTSALWPTDLYVNVLMHQANKTVLKNTTFDSPEEMRTFISKNFLKLQIFYETLDFMEMVTKPMYNWSNLLGSIGGNLGLWLGFSVLTALELLELCLDMVVVGVRRLRGREVAKN